MTVKYTIGHDIDTVWEKLTDPDFRVERSDALGEFNAECEVEVDGDGEHVTVTMSRDVERELPSVLAKVFSSRQSLNFTEQWDWDGTGWQGQLHVDVKGQPVKISADFSLMPQGDGCVYQITHRCKAKIPLVGGKVEKFILAETDDGARNELDYLVSVLG